MKNQKILWGLGIGDWRMGIGDYEMGPKQKTQ